MPPAKRKSATPYPGWRSASLQRYKCRSDWPDEGRSLAAIVRGVALRKVLPLVRHRILREDRAHRADRLARPAVDALVRVDVVLGRIVVRMDAVHRADLDARCVLYPD